MSTKSCLRTKSLQQISDVLTCADAATNFPICAHFMESPVQTSAPSLRVIRISVRCSYALSVWLVLRSPDQPSCVYVEAYDRTLQNPETRITRRLLSSGKLTRGTRPPALFHSLFPFF